MKQTKYSLNLSSRYVPNWGAWEVAREVISNAMDACPDGYTIERLGPDTLCITTPTCPDLSHLFIMGEGTKSVGGDDIGQFGEGLKLAALAATRTGNLTITTHESVIEFDFEKVMGTDVLHALVTEISTKNVTGMQVAITMTGIANVIKGRFLEDRKSGPLPVSKPGSLSIFCKGIFITTIPDHVALHDWNLNEIELNRDRSQITPHTLRVECSNWYDAHMTAELADELLCNMDSWEASSVAQFIYADSAKKLLSESFSRQFGDDAVTCSGDPKLNVKAMQKGHTVVTLSEGLRTALSGRVKTSVDVAVESTPDFEFIDIERYAEQIVRIRMVSDMLNAPNFTIRIFANRQEELYGSASILDNVINLSESLFEKGNELMMWKTFCHELGHIMSSANDCTREFEAALDGIAGRLAMQWMEDN